MKVTVCIGSSCHMKGSHQVVEQLRQLIDKNKLADQICLGSTFCMGKCQQGVCVNVDGEFHSVSPASTAEFFENNIIAKV